MKEQKPSRNSAKSNLLKGSAVFLLLAIIFAPPFGLHNDCSSYQCSSCLSRCINFQWRIGMWGESIPVSPQRESIVESVTFKRFTPLPHVHTWRLAQASPYYWLGTQWAGCGIGSGRHRNKLGSLLESSRHEFDQYITRQLSEGIITTNQLYDALISQPLWRTGTNQPTMAQTKAKQLVEDFQRQH